MSFTHFNEQGRAKMVEVTDKDDTKRVAIAEGFIRLNCETIEKITEGKIKKGDVLSVAQVAGIMGVKKTSDIIPMCHNIFLTGADIDFKIERDGVYIKSEVKTVGKTGVEMEALTGVSVAALTIYDMCKSIDKGMEIEYVRLLKKSGGVSGDYNREKIDHKMKVLEINRSDKKGVAKQAIHEGEFIEDYGLDGDAHSGKWHRQVSLLAIESYKKMEALGISDLPFGAFGENITTQGIELHTLPVGTILRIGDTIQEITQIGKECHDKCNIGKTVGKCVMPEEGVFTRILKAGTIKSGDKIEIEKK